jgi:hypothetical protein
MIGLANRSRFRETMQLLVQLLTPVKRVRVMVQLIYSYVMEHHGQDKLEL